MKYKITTAFLLIACSLMAFTVTAKNIHKDTMDYKPQPNPTGKFYMGNSLDGAIFSTATTDGVPNTTQRLSTLRFTMVLNIGATFNYDFSNHFGVYAGIDLKNVGYIQKTGDSTVKRRTYNLGIPVGVKFGDVRNHSYGFIGGGIDAPVNYREKAFIKRGDKQKFNEWFSKRTPAIMPYIFAGACIAPGMTIKLQYYLTNYMNTDFTTSVPGNPGINYKPYAGYNIHLILLSLGVEMGHSKNMMHKHPHQTKNTKLTTANF